ncbi:MAG: nicotinate phosphoribosyltransferase [Thermodesulfobacteriota bacterium]
MQGGSLAIVTDFYEITMAAVYHARGMNGPATFSLFAHDLPPERGFMVAAGLEDALSYLESFAFSAEDIAYLASLNRFKPGFLDYLAGVRFSGEVWAMAEGTVCFAEQPLLEITAPIIEAQLVETMIINIINLHSTLASKAARCVLAAQGRTLVDFSLRRTQGVQAGMAAARSSALVGFSGTSNVAAAKAYGINPVGTMAHSFVESFGDETAAFRAFAETFPDHTVILVDTYDSVAGLVRAIEVAGELKRRGHRLVGIRLDSGDLVGMSRQARAMLDQAGLEQAMVVVSGSLDEYRIADLLARGAQVDLFAVGTRMGSSADAPYLDLAYKLVSYDGRPTLKLSTGKVSWVAPKQIWRRLDDQGRIQGDSLGLRDEDLPGQPLLAPVMRQGRRLEPGQGWQAARQRYAEQIKSLPPQCLRLAEPRPLRVQASPALAQLQENTRMQALNRQQG